MRIENKHLVQEFEISKALECGKMHLGQIVEWLVDDSSSYHISPKTMFESFCDGNEIGDLSEAERYQAFIKYLRKVIHKIYFGFRVESVCESFYDAMALSIQESALGGNCLKDTIGECSGIMLFPKGFMEYAITNEGSFFRWFPDDEEGSIIFNFFDEFDYHYFSSIKEDSCTYLLATINALYLKKTGEVETIMIAKQTPRTIGNERVMNKMPFPIYRLDSSFFKTIIRTEGFIVRGFWRQQPCGKGRKERKLVYVKEFLKKGYKRIAPASKARSVA